MGFQQDFEILSMSQETKSNCDNCVKSFSNRRQLLVHISCS